MAFLEWDKSVTINQSKISLRTKARQQRAAIEPKVKATAGGRLGEIFNRHVQLKPNDIVAGYAATGSEIDCFPLLSSLHEAGVTCALPVIMDPVSPLIFCRWWPTCPMVAGAYGIMVPQDHNDILLPTVLLAPMLAFDVTGHRLGYGGGYYDRTIEFLRHHWISNGLGAPGSGALKVIGVAFEAQRVDNVPHAVYDQRLDAVVTEAGLYDFG
jgi:5-formyltetrahydrofolate cyclo-ligase